jgi:ubiquinone/menaquinone biosynthesis C-methylase UbiE
MHKKEDEIYRTRKQFFNDHAEAWLDMWYRNPDTGEFDRHRENFERMFSLLPLKPGDRVLDTGCGSGILVPMILERITGSGILYELDFAEKMIFENRKLHSADNVRFIVSDAAVAPLEDGSCDVVLCFACFPHFQDKEKTLLSLAGILKAEPWLSYTLNLPKVLTGIMKPAPLWHTISFPDRSRCSGYFRKPTWM